MSDHEFQANEFRSYKTTRAGLSLGFVDPASGGYVPGLDEVLQYDGTTVILKDGREFPQVPQLRSAIRQGWLVLLTDEPPTHRPKSAGIQVRDPEHRGNDKVSKRTVQTVGDEERYVGNVDTRRATREATEAGRSVPAKTQSAAPSAPSPAPQRRADPEVDDLLSVLGQADQAWQAQQKSSDVEPAVDSTETDIIALLNSVAEEASAPSPATPSRRAPTPAVASPTSIMTPTQTGAYTVERDELVRMPVVRADETEADGGIVGSVGARSKMVVEREQEVELAVAPATPTRAQSPAPSPRFGGTGAIVVDDQRFLGDIATSDSRPTVSLDESARVRPGTTDSVRGGEVQVGRRKMAVQSSELGEGSDGVTVGRLLSPTKFAPIATDATTSSTAITKIEQGRELRIERTVVRVDATGDADEALEGDELEELLPTAAKPPEAKPPEVYRPEAEDPAYEAVRMMIPDFKWDKDRKVKDKVADALKYVNNPMYLKGILAVESEIVRTMIKEELAKLAKAQGVPSV